MKCVNIDKEFRSFLQQWMKLNGKKYPNLAAMENAMPEVYEDFLNTPSPALGGATPRAYFDSFTDAGTLVNWMEDYYKQRIPVPDILLERIAALGISSEEGLMRLIARPRCPREARLTALSLLRQIDSHAPLQYCVELQRSRAAGEDEVADIALENLDSMGEAALPAMLEAFPLATASGKESLLGLISKYPCGQEVLQIALDMLRDPGCRISVIADYIGRLGFEEALPALTDLAGRSEVGYLDYIELRNAIERLGGTAPERSFSEDDPEYDALKALQERDLS